jgi:hypothetical protein
MNVSRSCTLLIFYTCCFLQIDFVSTTVKKYEISLVVDVEGVGEEILSLPIVAK